MVCIVVSAILALSTATGHHLLLQEPQSTQEEALPDVSQEAEQAAPVNPDDPHPNQSAAPSPASPPVPTFVVLSTDERFWRSLRELRWESLSGEEQRRNSLDRYYKFSVKEALEIIVTLSYQNNVSAQALGWDRLS